MSKEKLVNLLYDQEELAKVLNDITGDKEDKALHEGLFTFIANYVIMYSLLKSFGYTGTIDTATLLACCVQVVANINYESDEDKMDQISEIAKHFLPDEKKHIVGLIDMILFMKEKD